VTRELSPFSGDRHFLVRRWKREGGMRGLPRYVHLRNSHDSHLLFYSNWSEVGVARHIGTGGRQQGAWPYWYKAQTSELADLCRTEAWWPSGSDGDSNL